MRLSSVQSCVERTCQSMYRITSIHACMQAPLLDANFLDQLCLSDELWAKVEVPDVKGRLYMYKLLFISSDFYIHCYLKPACVDY